MRPKQILKGKTHQFQTLLLMKITCKKCGTISSMSTAAKSKSSSRPQWTPLADHHAKLKDSHGGKVTAVATAVLVSWMRPPHA